MLGRIAGWSLLGIVFLMGFSASAKAETVTAPLAQERPLIDGKLTDACWGKAVSLDDFHLLGVTEKPQVTTECLVTRDEHWLYIGFRCEEKGRAVQAAESGHNAYTGGDDSVEIFISPQKSGSQYYQFVLSAGRSWYEQKVSGRKKDREWQVPWKKATSVEKNGWTAEVGIPLYILGTNQIGKEPLAFNVTRNRRTYPNRYLTWAPLMGSFHEPENFGALSGLEGQPLASFCAPSISQSRAMSYKESEGQFVYLVGLKISNFGGKSGTATISFQDIPKVGERKTLTRKISIPPYGEQELEWEMPIEAFSERSARMTILDQEVPEWTTVRGVEALRPIMIFPDRNYYTDESEAQIVLQAIFTNEQALRHGLKLALEMKDATGKRIFHRSAESVKQRATFAVPMGKLAVGTYQAKATLTSKEGKELATAETELAKYPPAPSTEVKLDQMNEVILVDGKPFFPFGFMEALTLEEDTWRKIAGAGFNTIVNWGRVLGGDPLEALPEAKARLDLAHQCGLKVFEPACAFGSRLRYGDADLAKKLQETVDNLPQPLAMWREHPAVIGYYGIDEPSPAYYQYARQMYEVVHEEDPYRLMYSSNCGDWTPEGYEIFDLLGRHGYWKPGVCEYGKPSKLAYYWQPNACEFSRPNRIGGKTAMMAYLAKRFHRPFMATPQGCDFRAWRPMTRDETRISYYVPLIQGAKGLIIFIYRAGFVHPAWWEAAKEIAAEINQLAPILLPLSPAQKIECQVTEKPEKPVLPAQVGGIPAEFAPMPDLWTNIVLPRVQALIKNHPAGGEVILVANEGPAADVTFALSSVGKNTKVRDFFGGKEVRVRGNTFSEHLEGNAVRVYRIVNSNRRSVEDPVRMAINVVEAEAVPAEEGKPGPNILTQRNGDFESGEIGKFWIPTKGTEASVVAENAYAGKHCLALAANPEGMVSVNMASIPLKAQTSYRFGAWVRSEITEGKQSPEAMILVPGKHQTPPRMSIRLPLVQDEWTQVSRTFGTKEAVETNILLRLYAGKGTVYLDDFFLEEISGGTGGMEKPRNLLLNSSFEEATYFGIPDCWNVSTFSPDYPEWFLTYERQQEGEAVHGEHVVRVGWIRDTPPRGRFKHISTYIGTQLNYGKDYVFSIYLKGDREDLTVTLLFDSQFQIGASVNLSKTFQVGTEWKRYVFPIALSKEARSGIGPCSIGVSLDKKGIMYADCAQLEEGLTATAYTIDPYRAPDLGEEYSRKNILKE